MATIPLTWSSGEERLNFLQLVVTMIYPKNSRLRDQLFAAFLQAWLKSERSNAVPLNREEREGLERRVLYGLPPALFSECIGPGAIQSFGHGLIAGQILWQVLRLAEHAPMQASLSRARFLVERGLGRRQIDLRGLGNRRIIPSSSASISNAWSEFRSVSHFYAALIMAGTLERIDSHELARAEFLRLIALARLLCKEAEAHRSLRASDPIFKAGEAWTAPIPYDFADFSLQFPKIEAKELGLLTEYRSEDR